VEGGNPIYTLIQGQVSKHARAAAGLLGRAQCQLPWPARSAAPQRQTMVQRAAVWGRPAQLWAAVIISYWLGLQSRAR